METAPSPRFRRLRLTPDHVVPALLALEGLLLVAERFGWFTFDRHKGYPPLLAIAAVGAVFVLMLLCFLVALVFRRPFQFSLRSLLLLVVVVAIPCSWLSVEMKAAREQHTAMEAIQKLGGDVFYDYEVNTPAPGPPQPPGPLWLRERLGVNLLANVTFANFADSQPKIGDAGMEHLKGFTQLQDLYLNETEVSDAGLEHLKGLNQLRLLWLSGTEIGDAGLENLKGLTRLQSLLLDGTNVSDAGLEHLKGLTQLEHLDLTGTNVSNAGLENLKGLTQLQDLDLGYTKVNDAGLEYLNGLTQLEFVDLYRTKVSDAGVRKLQKALPTANIMNKYIMNK